MANGENCPGCADQAAPISGGHEPWHRHLADGPAAPISGGGNRMVAFKPLGERGPTVYRDMSGIAPEHMARLNGFAATIATEHLAPAPERTSGLRYLIAPQHESVTLQNTTPDLNSPMVGVNHNKPDGQTSYHNQYSKIVVFADNLTHTHMQESTQGSNPKGIPKVYGEDGRPTAEDDPNWKPGPTTPENPGPGDEQAAGEGKSAFRYTATDDAQEKARKVGAPDPVRRAYDELRKDLKPPPADPKKLNCPMKVRHFVEIYWIEKKLIGEVWNGSKKEDAKDLGKGAIAAVDPEDEVTANISNKVPEGRILQYLESDLRWKCEDKCKLAVSIVTLLYGLEIAPTIVEDTDLETGKAYYKVWIWRVHTVRAVVDIECVLA